MSLFSFFKRTPKFETKTNYGDINTDIKERGNRLKIYSLNFSGFFVCSKNSAYKLAWNKDTENYILLKNSKVIRKGHIKYPEDGKVANNGTFILHNSSLNGSLSSTLYIFDVSGKEIIQRKFKALLGVSDLSDDGKFAACHNGNSDDINDSGALTVFDITKGIELAQWYPENYPYYFKFYSDSEVIGLGDINFGVFRYSLIGEFLDRELWQDTLLSKGNYYNVLMMSENIIKESEGKLPSDIAERLLLCMDRIITEIPQNNMSGWEAMHLKLRGICLESKGDLENALTCYNHALMLNSKIGVKQRVTKIKKILSNS